MQWRSDGRNGTYHLIISEVGSWFLGHQQLDTKDLLLVITRHLSRRETDSKVYVVE
jgi:hypothetical protein